MHKSPKNREDRGYFSNGTSVAIGSAGMKEAYRKMKLIDFKNKFAGTLFALALLFGIGLGAKSTAQAQYPRYPDTYRRDRDRDRDYRRDRDNQRRRSDYPYYGGSFDFRQTAMNAGYNEGIKAGRDDRRRGERFEFRDEGAYRSANKDYNSRYGDRSMYQAYFRQAFQTGYSDGYRGY
jgi:hypothetical protein